MAMTERQESIIQSFRGQRAGVLGIGASNIPVLEFLVKCGARVTACDRKTREELEPVMKRFSGLGVEWRLGEGYLCGLEEFDVIFPTPGMPLDLPELARARAFGVRESSETELFFGLCEAPIVGITGSDGKTTTTTLVGNTLREAGKNVFIGGNIGNSLLPVVLDIPKDAVVVLELSSFQLQPLRVSPHVGVILNIHPNHLDHHRSMEEYIASKENIIKYQAPHDFAVLNLDNPVTGEMASRCLGKVIPFSRQKLLSEGVFLSGDDILVKLGGREVRACSRADIRLRGEHNVENLLAVTAVTWVFCEDFEPLRKVIREFGGVPHRLELVGEIGGIMFYDDSIATTPSRAIAGLNSFREPIILIAGGSDKKVPFEDFAREAVRRCKAIVLLGETAPKIGEAISKVEGGPDGCCLPSVIYAEDLEDATQKAWEFAESGDVILLSPACASFDMFRDYKERGEKFKQIVARLSKDVNL